MSGFKAWWMEHIPPYLFYPFMFWLAWVPPAWAWFKKNWAERISPTGE